MTDLLTTPQQSPPGRRALRVAAIVAYIALLVAWISIRGLPKQAPVVLAWMWLAVVAWDVRRPWRQHLAFLRDWWPIFGLLIVYLYSRGFSDDLGFVSVHVTEPIAFDRWLFGGTVPTEWLQARLCGDPCDRSLPPRWYDVALTTVYTSHFFASLGLGAVLWLRDRPGWVSYMRRYVSLTAAVLVVYIAYPMAPPWMAARDGHLSSGVHRITGRGWDILRHGASSASSATSSGTGSGTGSGTRVHEQMSAVGNQVAAMPSLHAALALFVAVVAITRWSSPWRWAMLAYPLAMSFALVYYAEHYVVDILAGFAMVGLVMVAVAAWERRFRPVPAHEPAHKPAHELAEK